jgi:hypothetical protein
MMIQNLETDSMNLVTDMSIIFFFFKNIKTLVSDFVLHLLDPNKLEIDFMYQVIDERLIFFYFKK